MEDKRTSIIFMALIISNQKSKSKYTRIFKIQDKITLPGNFAAPERAASLEIGLK